MAGRQVEVHSGNAARLWKDPPIDNIPLLRNSLNFSVFVIPRTVLLTNAWMLMLMPFLEEDLTLSYVNSGVTLLL